jgi:dTDP-4-dehydrorhamnose reductase
MTADGAKRRGSSERPPVLVLGSAGQVARALARQGTVGPHPILCRGRPEGDLTNSASLERLVDEVSPAAVVNAAAYTAVDKAEADPAAAFAVNATGPAFLAALCRDRDLPLLHLSTDYVFDGSSRKPYLETDAITPLSVYGASKAAGEAAVRRTWPKHLVLRTAWVYSADGHNFLNTMLRLGSEREQLSVVDDQHGSPTWADDIAAAIATALARVLTRPEIPALWGTYHLTNSGDTSWYGFAREIFRLAAAAGRKTPSVIPIPAAAYPLPARRPAYSVLDTRKIKDAFGIELPPWQTSLAACFAHMEMAAAGKLTEPGAKVA